MRKEDLSAADQALLNTDFGDLDKIAAEQVKVAGEMYDAGAEMAEATADQLDKLAEENEKEDEDEDEGGEEEKKAASDYGNIIAEGFIDKLAALGVERHGNEAHYFLPFVEEKVAAVGARAALEKFAASKASFLSTLGNKAKEVGGKVKSFAKGVKSDTVAAATGKTGRGRELSAMERLGKLKRPGMVAGGLGAAGGTTYALTRGKKKEEASA